MSSELDALIAAEAKVVTYREFADGKLTPGEAYAYAAKSTEAKGIAFNSLNEGGYLRGLDFTIQKVVTSDNAEDMLALQGLIELGKIYMKRHDMAGDEIDWFTAIFMTTNAIRSMVKAPSDGFNSAHAIAIIDALLAQTKKTELPSNSLSAKDIEMLMMRVGVQQMNTASFPLKKGLVSAIIERLSAYAGIDEAGRQNVYNSLLYNNAKSYRNHIVEAILYTDEYEFFAPETGFKAYLERNGMLAIDEERYRELSAIAFQRRQDAKREIEGVTEDESSATPLEYMV